MKMLSKVYKLFLIVGIFTFVIFMGVSYFNLSLWRFKPIFFLGLSLIISGFGMLLKSKIEEDKNNVNFFKRRIFVSCFISGAIFLFFGF